MSEYDFEEPLDYRSMVEQMDRIMTARCKPEEIRTFLSTLAARGETSVEIAAAVESLRSMAVPLPLKRPLDLADTCGTGGDGLGTINVSTLAALVAAAGGVAVAKHGNRAASSRCGSADVLEALGVDIEAPPERVARSIQTFGFGFCYARSFHPAMRIVGQVRKELGIRTIFNLIGPLANPAKLAYQLVGVSEARLLRPMAEALQRLGVHRAMVVHGSDGMDEVTTVGPTQALEVGPGGIMERRLLPEMFDVPMGDPETLKGSDAASNAEAAIRVLKGNPSGKRDLVVVNAACVLYLAGITGTLEAGAARATELLIGGEALELLEKVKSEKGQGSPLK